MKNKDSRLTKTSNSLCWTSESR